MIDPDSRHGRDLKAAEEFFALAKTAPTTFMRSYYQRVAERADGEPLFQRHANPAYPY
jgi:hypothetical protein